MTDKPTSSSQSMPTALFWAADTPACQAISQSLATSFTLTKTTLLLDLKTHMDAQPETPAFLIYDSATSYIHEALALEISPEDALRQWHENSQPLLELQETFRDRITLLDGAAIIQNPEPFLEKFSADPAPLQQANHAAKASMSPEQRSRADLVAQYALKLDPSSDLLANALEAVTSCLPPQRDTPLQSILHLLTDLQTQSQAAATTEDRAAKETTHEGDQNTKKSAQELTAASAAEENERLETRLAQQLADLQSQNDTLAQQDSRIAQLKAEIGDQDLRIIKLQTEAETANLRLEDRDTQLTQQIAHIEHQNMLLSQQSNLLADRTAELAASRQETKAKQENVRALRSQLATLLEDMRSLHILSENRLQQLEQERAEQHQKLEGEIQRIMNSRSIKLTEPLRRLTRLFSSKG